MRNIRLTIAYDGTDFRGWQRQLHGPTIQLCLEGALESIAGEPIKIVGSGRTDAGVHAACQVANFKTSSRIPCPNLISALNSLLPPTVQVKEAQEASDEFHARYAARSKTYRYRILQAPVCSPFIARFVSHCPHLLDRTRMAEAARRIEGRHDFSSFAGAAGAERGAIAVHKPPLSLSQDYGPDSGVGVETTERSRPNSTSGVRTIFRSRIIWHPKTSILIYEVRGNGFLHHMVRNIVGTLIEVGRGKLEVDDMLRILEARDRTRAGPTAPAQGLCLMKVEY